jgi:tungstate transport system substrate-binding protein
MRRAIFAVLMAVAGAAACARPAPTLTLATTTSVGNSGLLDTVRQAYEGQTGTALRTHLVGSGRALAMLASRDVDEAITHAPAAEEAFLAAHPAWRYTKVMFNEFVLVGPPGDPANVKRAPTVAIAMTRIAASGERFISRGDSSGTHEREELLWKDSGSRPAHDRLVIAGAGMGATLRVASETGAYTLTDRATFAQHVDGLALVALFEGAAEFMNTYAVITNPEAKCAGLAASFAAWLTIGDGRAVIESFQIRSGGPAFRPWPLSRPRSAPSDTPQ